MKNVNVLLIVTALLTSACREEKKPVQTDNTIAVKVISTAASGRVQPIETSGLLASDQEAYLSFKVGGIIREVHVREGDAVRKGQELATLNTTEAAAQAAQAEENYVKARRDAERSANLYKDSVSTKEQLENSLTASIVAQKQLEIARYNLSQTRIVATSDGVVVSKLHNAGEQVQGGTPVLYISSNKPADWIVKCGLTDADWARLRGGEHAVIRFDALPEPLTGSVKSLAQAADPASGLYQAEIRIHSSKARLAAGLFAHVTIDPKTKTDMIAVPMDALLEGENDSAFVFVANGSKAMRKAVKVAYLDGDRAYIQSGITSGESVIREGSAYLTDGSEIRVIQ